MKELRIAVLVPCGHVKAGFVESLVRAVHLTDNARSAVPIAMDFLCGQGALIADLRNNMVMRAIRDHAPTHLLMIDDDMVFPEDAIVRLLNHNLPCVGVNYPRRSLPAKPVARKLDDSDFVATTPQSTGLEEVLFTGMGMMMVKAGLIERLGIEGKMPLFDVRYEPDPKCEGRWRPVGEDTFFCRQIRSIGEKVYVDHDLSNEIKHIGEFAYTNAMACIDEDVREELAA